MKKSFVLYTDQRDIFEMLNSAQCKELILAIFNYPEKPNKPLTRLVNIAFMSIKSQLKRDFEKWERNSEMRKEYGRMGGIAKASISYLKPVLLSKPAVNDNVNVINKTSGIKNNLVSSPNDKTPSLNSVLVVTPISSGLNGDFYDTAMDLAEKLSAKKVEEERRAK